jgi:DNA-binding response OmpR family regulator
MRSIGIIEADSALSSNISAELRAVGLQSVRIPPEEGERAAAGQSFVLLLIDLASVADAVNFCRSAAAHQPVIAVAANSSCDSCVDVIEAGADDCVPRTIKPREMIARIRNVLWRAASSCQSVDARRLDPIEAMRVRVGNEVRNLSRGEAEVLALLLEHSPAPLTIEEILSLLPRSLTVKRATIVSRLKSLRQKLGPGWIEVRAGFGYQIVNRAPFEESA